MARSDKPVRLSRHAEKQLRSRGATVQEVVEAIRTEPWQPAELGKLECRKDFAYNALWNGKHYATKQVRPIFVEEPSEIEGKKRGQATLFQVNSPPSPFPTLTPPPDASRRNSSSLSLA